MGKTLAIGGDGKFGRENARNEVRQRCSFLLFRFRARSLPARSSSSSSSRFVCRHGRRIFIVVRLITSTRRAGEPYGRSESLALGRRQYTECATEITPRPALFSRYSTVFIFGFRFSNYIYHNHVRCISDVFTTKYPEKSQFYKHIIYIYIFFFGKKFAVLNVVK